MQYRNDNISYSDNSKDINGLLDKFIGEARVAYSIPEEAFNSYRVKRGLREADGTGITAGVTKIGNAHGYIIYEGERVPTEGVLEYRGYDVSQLVENSMGRGQIRSFEECTYLLFRRARPPLAALRLCALLDAYRRRLPPDSPKIYFDEGARRSLMNKIATGAGTLCV